LHVVCFLPRPRRPSAPSFTGWVLDVISLDNKNRLCGDPKPSPGLEPGTASLSGRRRDVRSDEFQESRVDLVRMGPADVVRASLDGDEGHVGDQVGQAGGRRLEREDPVLDAVDDEDRDVDLRQVGPEVGEPRVDAGVRRPRGCDVEARLPGLLADPLRRELVDVVEVVEEILEVRVAVLDDRSLDRFEDGSVDTLGVVRRLEEKRRDRSEEMILVTRKSQMTSIVVRQAGVKRSDRETSRRWSGSPISST